MIRKRRKMRGKSVVWDHFTCHEDEGQGSSPTGGKARPAAFCSYCNLKYTFPNATKMMRHLLKCANCPDDTKRELEQSGFGEYRTDLHHSAVTSNTSSMTNGSLEERGCYGSVEEDLVTGPSVLFRQRQSLSPIYPHQENDSPTPGTSALSPHASLLMVGNPLTRTNHREPKTEPVDHDASRYDCTSDQVSQTDRLLARAIFRTDVPLSIVESSHWQDFFRHLTPSYALPSKNSLVGTHLEEEYMSAFETVSSEINKTKCTALLAHSHQDKFSVRNDPSKERVNLVITTPQPIFLAGMDTGDQQCPSDIADVLAGVITKIEPAQVLLVVTDLKQNVRDAWPTLATRFPNTTIAGNPVEGICNVLRCILKQKRICEMFKRACLVCTYRNRLIDQGSGAMSKLVKLSFSRARTEDICIKDDSMIVLETLMECKEQLQDSVVADGINADAETKDIILNKVFWAVLSFTVTMWRTLNLAKSKLELEGIRVSDVAMEILHIDRFLDEAISASPLQPNECNTILKELDAIREACCTGIHCAACLLDPRYCGTSLSDKDTSAAIEYIVNFAKRAGQESGRVIANLAEYRAKDGGLWSKPYVWDAASHVAPATWWRGICDRQPLSPIAEGLLGIAATSSMTAFEFIDRDEGLNRDQEQKLVFVRANSELSQQANARPDMIMLPGRY